MGECFVVGQEVRRFEGCRSTCCHHDARHVYRCRFLGWLYLLCTCVLAQAARFLHVGRVGAIKIGLGSKQANPYACRLRPRGHVDTAKVDLRSSRKNLHARRLRPRGHVTAVKIGLGSSRKKYYLRRPKPRGRVGAVKEMA